MMRSAAIALSVSGCSYADVPGLSGTDYVIMNPLCLAICTPVMTLADTDTGSGSSNVSQTATATPTAGLSGTYSPSQTGTFSPNQTGTFSPTSTRDFQ